MTLITHWRAFCSVIHRDTNIALDTTIKKAVTSYISSDLGRQRDTNDDLPAYDLAELRTLLRYLWCRDLHRFKSKRHRIQLAFLLVMIGHSGLRPGALVAVNWLPDDSAGVLLYRDCRLVLLRPEPKAESVFALVIRLRHLSGETLKETPRQYKIFMTEHPTPLYTGDKFWGKSFCSVRLLLALAFSDDAFQGLKSPSELYELKAVNTAQIKENPWKPSILNTSIMRQFDSATGTISPTKCLTYDTAYSQADKLAFRCGFLEKFNFYGFRRGVANLVDNAGTEAQSNHLMNHSGSRTFHSTYVSKTCMDTQQILLGLPERQDLSRLISRKSVLRDERAPTQLPFDIAEEVKKSEPVTQKLVELKSRLTDKYGSVHKSPSANQVEIRSLSKQAKGRVNTAREKRLHLFRREWFAAENLKATGRLEPEADPDLFSSRLDSYVTYPIGMSMSEIGFGSHTDSSASRQREFFCRQGPKNQLHC